MNDFSKEELEEIKRCLKYMINGGITPYSLLTMNTKKKVQNIIDRHSMDDCPGNGECLANICDKCARMV